jgi:hypothetical protein
MAIITTHEGYAPNCICANVTYLVPGDVARYSSLINFSPEVENGAMRSHRRTMDERKPWSPKRL